VTKPVSIQQSHIMFVRFQCSSPISLDGLRSFRSNSSEALIECGACNGVLEAVGLGLFSSVLCASLLAIVSTR
jgi:hypothetical protein